LPGLIDHVVRHLFHASPGEEHEIGIFGQIDAAMARHFPKDAFRSIPLYGIAKSSTHHDSNPIMGKLIWPMQNLKIFRSNPATFIEHSLKIRAIPKNMSMPSHDVGKTGCGHTERRVRPLDLRRARTLRPFFVRLRTKKP
jgi:hypothetical protein